MKILTNKKEGKISLLTWFVTPLMAAIIIISASIIAFVLKISLLGMVVGVTIYMGAYISVFVIIVSVIGAIVFKLLKRDISRWMLMIKLSSLIMLSILSTIAVFLFIAFIWDSQYEYFYNDYSNWARHRSFEMTVDDFADKYNQAAFSQGKIGHWTVMNNSYTVISYIEMKQYRCDLDNNTSLVALVGADDNMIHRLVVSYDYQFAEGEETLPDDRYANQLDTTLTLCRILAPSVTKENISDVYQSMLATTTARYRSVKCNSTIDNCKTAHGLMWSLKETYMKTDNRVNLHSELTIYLTTTWEEWLIDKLKSIFPRAQGDGSPVSRGCA